MCWAYVKCCSCFLLFKGDFFKDDFSGVNFTARKLPTFPTEKWPLTARLLGFTCSCACANPQELFLQNLCSNRKNFRLEARAQLFEFRLRALQKR